LAADDAPMTTVSHWYMHQWVEDDDGEVYENNKRSGFLPYLNVPKHVAVPMEMALCFGLGDEREQAMLEERGWRIRQTATTTSTPGAYQRYIQSSLGEFSCAKPAYVRLQTAWVSDRTLCYLASGKPVIVEDTGPSGFLPLDRGMIRFRSLDEAITGLNMVATDYDVHAHAARAIAEEYFDGARIAGEILELVMS
jgi:hypothetical protein